nr:hypothetical protein asmbl_9 [uncultured bacterium]
MLDWPCTKHVGVVVHLADFLNALVRSLLLGPSGSPASRVIACLGGGGHASADGGQAAMSYHGRRRSLLPRLRSTGSAVRLAVQPALLVVPGVGGGRRAMASETAMQLALNDMLSGRHGVDSYRRRVRCSPRNWPELACRVVGWRPPPGHAGAAAGPASASASASASGTRHRAQLVRRHPRVPPGRDWLKTPDAPPVMDQLAQRDTAATRSR